MSDKKPPDFEAYHRSVTAEIRSLKDRVRDLIQHWPTDGALKEAVLRSVLRRHLPEMYLVGRGFVVTESRASTEIDLLIVDRSAPTLFKDGDLLIVTPQAVRAIIEVKTSRKGPKKIEGALQKIAGNLRLFATRGSVAHIWSGLFVYEGNHTDTVHKNLLMKTKAAWDSAKTPVNAIAWNTDTFVRFWGNGVNVWRSYRLGGLAPAYFLGNLLLALGGGAVQDSSYAWFPERGGKESRACFEIGFADAKPRRCETARVSQVSGA